MDIKEFKQLKEDVKTQKEELKQEFLFKNQHIVEIQKKRDDLLRKYGLKSEDLNTSSGLYNVAVENGLQKQANKVIQDNSGEEYKKIFSGGFISDIFDVLNVVSYGTVGVLKGKGFVEGIKNRESFADDDAFGQYGLVGAIGGIALDIATDPLTYIAPWTIAKNIPGVAKAVKFSKKAIFGETVEKTFQEGGSTLSKLSPLVTDPLVTEIKKYRSVKEFVKKRGVQRIEEPGVSVSFNKPQGLYTTPSKVKSPHLDLGGKKSEFVIKPGMKEVAVDTSKISFAERGIDQSATNLVWLRQSFPKIASDIRGKNIKELRIIFSKEFPQKNWNRYTEIQDMIEGYAGLKAREQGIDIIRGIDKTDPRFSEVVILNKNAVLTKSQLKDIWEKAQQPAQKTVAEIRGGTVAGRFIAKKLSYMFGADPVFKNLAERMTRNIGTETVAAKEIFKNLAKMDKKLGGNLADTIFAVKNEAGRTSLIRKPLSEIQRNLSTEDFKQVEEIFNKIDNVGKQLVDEGVLSAEKYQENINEYIHQYYENYVQASNKPFVGGLPGIKGTKKRTEVLSETTEAARIENPGYVLGRTLLEMTKDLETAKMFNKVNDIYAVTKELPGFKQLSVNTPRFQTKFGRISELRSQFGDLNKELKPLLRELKSTFKTDRKLMSEINGIEKKISRLQKMNADELSKFFSIDRKELKETTSTRKLGIIPDSLQKNANDVKKYDNYDDFIASKEGIELEKLDVNGDLQRSGFRSMKEFFDTVKHPYKAGGIVKTKEILSIEDKISNLESKLKIKSGKKLSQAEKAEQLKLNKQLKKATKKLQKLQKEASSKVSKSKELITANKLSRIDELMKNTKLGKEAFKELNRLKTNILKAKGRLSKLKDSELQKIENTLQKYENKLVSTEANKLVNLQKQIERLVSKSEKLKEIDKKSINDLFIYLEKNISDIRFAKEDILEEIKFNTLGQLNGKYVPEYIANNLAPELLAPTTKSMLDRVLGEFKYAKVILSPAAMSRNLISNMILNYWKLGLIPGDKAYIKAAKALKEGDLNRYVKLAKPLGFKADSMAANEFRQYLQPEGKGFMKAYNKLKNVMGDLYQGEESFAKMAAFIKQVDKGISPEEAWKIAESATFNYAEVTPFIRKMRTAWYGVPFITFPVKATPLVIETALKKPMRISVIGKIRNAIEEQADYDETMREKETEPQWIKDGFFVKLPIKDSEGRSAFFDLTYILPFGDLLSGQLFTRGISRETGVKESIPSAIASKNPFFNLVKEMSRNQDFSGNRIWKESDPWEKQLLDLQRHIFKTFSPPPIADQIPGGYNSKNERVEQGLYASLTPEEKANQKRTVTEELLKSVGIKIQPIDSEIQESMNEWQKKKGLRTLLKDNSVVSDFTSVYQK